MNTFRAALLVCRLNLYKWIKKPNILCIFVVQAAFLVNHLSGLRQFSQRAECPICPWVFPFLLSPMVLVFFCALATLLFADAPFLDREYTLVAIRTGRKTWLLGQLIYICAASLIFSVTVCLTSIVVLLPYSTFSSGWGKLLLTLADSPFMAKSYGVTASVITITKDLTMTFSPAQAMLLGIVLLWLVSMLIGVLIMFFGIFVKPMSGIAASAFFIVLSYFSYFQGAFSLGSWVTYISPYTWASPLRINWYNVGGNGPTPLWCFTWLIALILMLGTLSLLGGCHYDLEAKNGKQYN